MARRKTAKAKKVSPPAADEGNDAGDTTVIIKSESVDIEPGTEPTEDPVSEPEPAIDKEPNSESSTPQEPKIRVVGLSTLKGEPRAGHPTGNSVVKNNEISCKKRWVNIRDQYKKSLNRRKTRSGQAAGLVVKRYKYEDVLQFLPPHIQERETISNMDPPPSNDQPVDESHELVPQVELNEGASNESNPDDHEEVSVTSATPIERGKKRKAEKTPQPESASSVLMKYIVESQKNKRDKHPVDIFLESISPQIKNLSPYRQHLARGRIFTVVQQLEAEEHFGAPASSTPEVPPTSSPSSPGSSNNDYYPNHNVSQNENHSHFNNPLS